MSLEDADLLSKTAATGWSLIGSSANAAVARGSTVTFNKRIWNLNGDRSRTVVSSPDGVDWSANASLPYHIGSAACAHDGALWVTGGEMNGVTSDVYRSTDGVTWSHSVAPWPPRYGHCLVSDGDHMTLVGGRTEGQQWYMDCWISRDGITWTSGGTAETVVHGALAVVGPDLCLINPINRFVWWYAGGRWLLVETPPWSERAAPGVTVVNDVLYVVGGGQRPANANDLWAATGPATWSPQPSAPWSGLRSAPGCGELDGAMIVFGGSDASGAVSREIYRYTPS